MIRAVPEVVRAPATRAILLRLALFLIVVRLAVRLPLRAGLPDLGPVFHADPFLALLDVFSGGALARGSALALGPYPFLLGRLAARRLATKADRVRKLSYQLTLAVAVILAVAYPLFFDHLAGGRYLVPGSRHRPDPHHGSPADRLAGKPARRRNGGWLPGAPASRRLPRAGHAPRVSSLGQPLGDRPVDAGRRRDSRRDRLSRALLGGAPVSPGGRRLPGPDREALAGRPRRSSVRPEFVPRRSAPRAAGRVRRHPAPRDLPPDLRGRRGAQAGRPGAVAHRAEKSRLLADLPVAGIPGQDRRLPGRDGAPGDGDRRSSSRVSSCRVSGPEPRRGATCFGRSAASSGSSLSSPWACCS